MIIDISVVSHMLVWCDVICELVGLKGLFASTKDEGKEEKVR
jgi:hypothetical protein